MANTSLTRGGGTIVDTQVPYEYEEEHHAQRVSTEMGEHDKQMAHKQLALLGNISKQLELLNKKMDLLLK